jgi:tetratricopeptide (TPR) repeat protein
MRLLYLASLFFLIIVISACSSSPKTKLTDFSNIALNNQAFNTNNIQALTEQELFTLTAEQQQSFLTFHQKKLQQGIKSHYIISDYLHDYLTNFTYYGQTYTATQTMEKRQGNCMSLAIFTTALARLVNVEISYREVSTIPVFEQHNNILLSSSHVQSILYDPDFVAKEDYLYLSKPSVVIDYFPSKSNVAGRNLDHQQFIGMYYQNIAANALVLSAIDKAFLYAKKGFEFDPNSTKLLNILAVLHRRKGDLTTAQTLYLAGLNGGNESLTLLSNYIVLLNKQKNYQQAEKIRKKLEKLDDPNPYSWLEQAYMAQNQHKYRKAIHYYRKTLENAPYVHQAYIGLYQIYLKQNQEEKAQQMLEKALEWIYEFEQRKMYKVKLFQLQANL